MSLADRASLGLMDVSGHSGRCSRRHLSVGPVATVGGGVIKRQERF